MLPFISEKQALIYDWLMRPVSSDKSPIERLGHRTARVCFAIVRDIMQGNVSLHAMSLVFTSILSIVPLLALSFSLLRYFNVQNHFMPAIEHFLLPMGEKGQEILNSILQFVDNVKVGVLGAVGLVLLLYTVVSLVQKVEHAFNQIWYVASTRSVSRRLSNYMSMIFVGPILLVAGISLASGVLDSAIVTKLRLVEPLGFVFSLVTDVMPVVVLIAAFTFFYTLVPNTRVKTSSALIGAIVAGIAWQIAGKAFTAFVVSSARYDMIYSGFAVGIVALLWLYASWLILLLGSVIAFYVQNDNYITRSLDMRGSPIALEKIALQVMVSITQAQEKNGKPIKQAELETTPNIPGLLIRQVVETLLKKKLILDAGSEGDRFVLARSSDLISVADILSAIRKSPPLYRAFPQSGAQKNIADVSQVLDGFIKEKFAQVSLRELAEGKAVR